MTQIRQQLSKVKLYPIRKYGKIQSWYIKKVK